MGLLDRVFTLERRGWGNADDRWYSPIGSLSPSKAGVYVSDETAMRCATVYACVRVLAESIASLPVHLYERQSDGGRRRASEHWAYQLMHDEPHPHMSACQFFETLVIHMALTGNHFSFIDSKNSGEVGSLSPLNPRDVEILRGSKGQVAYKYTKNGEVRIFPEAEILHAPGMAWDGVSGMSPISYARETIGLSIAAEEFGARLFSHGLNPGSIFTLPEGVRMDQEQTTKFIEDLISKHAGLGKSHSGLVLPAGMGVDKVGISPEDSQFLETRKFQKAEIASIFRVPLHLIQEHEKSTTWGTGIEHINLGFVQYTLRPWLVRIEQTLNRKLLHGADRQRYYFEFLVDAMLRGDQQARAEYFTAAIQNGWMSRNEVRQLENRNPVEGGDDFLVPLNMSVAGEPPPEPPADEPDEKKSECGCGHEHRAEPDPELDIPRMSIQRSYRRVIRDAISRVMRRERNDIMSGAEKHLRKRAARGELRSTKPFADFIDEFYESHREFTREAVTAAFTALAEAVGAEAMREIGREWEWNEDLERWVAEYIQAFADNYANQGRGQLLALLDELENEFDDIIDTDVIYDGFSTRFDEWEFGMDGGRSRDDKIAQGESVRLGEGFARAAFFAAGVAALVWRATGSETCPYCMALNGRSVGANEFFLLAGANFQPAGAESPLRPGTNIGHPPAHAACDCIVVPRGF